MSSTSSFILMIASIITKVNRKEVFIMANKEIRRTAKASGVPLWKIADKLGISEPTMSRKLRHELPEAEQTKILNIINELAKEC